MKKTQCSICLNSNLPINDSIKIEGKIYCNKCLSKEFKDNKSLENLKIEKEFDPTVCANCNKDGGVVDFNKIANHPICEECKINIDKKIFPTWVKAFLIAILIIVLFSIWWNYRFYQSYKSLNNAYIAIAKGDLPNVIANLNICSKHTPEIEDIKMLQSFYKGIDLLGQDKSKLALIEFERYKDKFPPDYIINYYIQQANIGIAADNKNYEGFLNSAKECLNYDSTAGSYAYISSAYSCLYSQNGKMDNKLKAIEFLKIAKSKDDTTKRLLNYYNLISYRIANKTDISSKVFDSIYPNGWAQK